MLFGNPAQNKRGEKDLSIQEQRSRENERASRIKKDESFCQMCSERERAEGNL